MPTIHHVIEWSFTHTAHSLTRQSHPRLSTTLSQPPGTDSHPQPLHCTLTGGRHVDSCPSALPPLFSRLHALAHPPEVEGCLWLPEFACISLLHLFVAITVVVTAALTVLVILTVAVIVGAFLLHRLFAVAALQGPASGNDVIASDPIPIMTSLT